MLVLTQDDVEELLDLDELVDAVGAAMADLSAGRTSMPPRAVAAADRSGLLAAMPAFLPSSGTLTSKILTIFERNRERPSHQAVICCFDPDDGAPIALMDGNYITAARTAAGSALATRMLSRRGPIVATVIGTGVQARAHARAVARLAGVETVQIAGREEADALALAARLLDDGVRATAAPSIEQAVRSADVVSATTHADRPVVRREWLAPGTHVNSVGYNLAGEGEIDLDTVRDALVVVESRKTAVAPPPAGSIEVNAAIERGMVTPEHLVEIGELVAGTARGRADDDQITLYKSVGVAIQDAAAAALVLRAASDRGAGTPVHLA
jgi:ornithine cyclodeaminase/alanine dehydrogenase-like protein (mu-crystallin family)